MIRFVITKMIVSRRRSFELLHPSTNGQSMIVKHPFRIWSTVDFTATQREISVAAVYLYFSGFYVLSRVLLSFITNTI